MVDPYREIRSATRAEWLQSRRGGIGSSDAACLLGASPWGTPLSVWADKASTRDPDDDDDNATKFTNAGKFLEHGIGQYFQHDTGIAVTPERPFSTYAHLVHPFMRASPDAWVDLSLAKAREMNLSAVNPQNGKGYIPSGRTILEIKNTAAWMADEWNDGPPLHIMIQVQHQMFVLGLSWCFVCVLIGGNTLKWHFVHYDHKFAEGLLRKCSFFWQANVIENQEPVASSGMDRETLGKLYSEASSSLRQVDAQWLEIDGKIQAEAEQIRLLQASVDKNKAKIQQAIGGKEGIILPSGVVWTNKLQQRKASVRRVAATSFRVLRRKAARKK